MYKKAPEPWCNRELGIKVATDATEGSYGNYTTDNTIPSKNKRRVPRNDWHNAINCYEELTHRETEKVFASKKFARTF